MELSTFKQFLDFELLDTGDGFRLEQWGQVRLIRPDPQIIWQKSLPDSEWQKADAEFTSNTERGRWNIKSKLPEKWEVNFRPDIKFVAKLSPFKHTGIFAEQAANWEWLMDLTKNCQPLRILNLFAYTGGATMVLTRLGHHVTHVDASKPALTWAKENQLANKFNEDSIRWILDDCLKFASRELKRGATYDGIILDPPAFGHSPSGSTWKFNRDLPKLLQTCERLLSPDAKFLLLNSYATNSSSLSLQNLMEDVFATRGGQISSGELCLKHKIKTAASNKSSAVGNRLISTGIFSRWEG